LSSRFRLFAVDLEVDLVPARKHVERLGLTTTDVPDRVPVDHDFVGPKHVAERPAQALERYLRGRARDDPQSSHAAVET